MRTSFHHQPEAQHPNFQLSTSWQADYPIYWHIASFACSAEVRTLLGAQRTSGEGVTWFGATRLTHSVIGGPIFAVMHDAALDPANLTTGVSQGVCCRSSTKVMVNGWPAMVFPSASVNGKDAHRLSVCATAMRYDERSAFDASLD